MSTSDARKPAETNEVVRGEVEVEDAALLLQLSGTGSENLGVLSHEALARAMNDAHVLLCFSLSANISWVPLQGMACGCAVVDADVPGVREMIADGQTCRLAAPDPASVAAALLSLVDDAAARERIARAAAAEMQRGGWDASARQFERILTEHCFVRLDRAQRGQSRLALRNGA